MKVTAHLVLFSRLGLFVGFLIFAQQATAGKENTGSRAWNTYDLNTIVTVRGEVQRVEEYIPAKGMPPWVQLSLRTDQGELLAVYLCPQWYFEKADFEIEPKDRIEVKGSRIMHAGSPAIVAGVVFRGEAVLKLRDEKGLPVWGAWLPRR